MSAGGLSADELADALLLRIQEHESWNYEAATRLVIVHGTWLRRRELREHVQVDTRTRSAWVDWAAVTTEPDHSPASSSERAVLRLACSLAGYLPENCDESWSLGDILTPLDATNSLLASRAVALAALGPAAVGEL